MLVRKEPTNFVAKMLDVSIQLPTKEKSANSFNKEEGVNS